jgi:hypothetical protein
MSTTPDTRMIAELRERVHQLHHRNIDLERQVTELRATVEALLAPVPSEVANPLSSTPVKFSDKMGDWLPPLSS